MLEALGVKRDRPLGISVLAVAVVAFGIVTALLGIWHAASGLVLGIIDSPRHGGFSLLEGIAGIVLGAVYVVAGAGLWSLRPWAWWLAVLVSVVGVVIAYPAIFMMVVWAALLVYLALVRGSFGVLGTRPHPVSG